jgi:hypothetical protein
MIYKNIIEQIMSLKEDTLHANSWIVLHDKAGLYKYVPSSTEIVKGDTMDYFYSKDEAVGEHQEEHWTFDNSLNDYTDISFHSAAWDSISVVQEYEDEYVEAIQVPSSEGYDFNNYPGEIFLVCPKTETNVYPTKPIKKYKNFLVKLDQYDIDFIHQIHEDPSFVKREANHWYLGLPDDMFRMIGHSPFQYIVYSSYLQTTTKKK